MRHTAQPDASTRVHLSASLRRAQASRSSGDCFEMGRQSLRCIEQHGYNRSAPECKPHFDAYKECKKQMADEKREASRQGGNKGLFG